MALPKPDPSRYRGGSRSRYYREDLAAWEAKQKTTPDYTIQPVGAEEVVSLASSFDEEADPFVPLVDLDALADSDFTFNLDLSGLNQMFEPETTLGEGVTEERLESFGVQLQEDMLANIGKTRADFDAETLADPIKFNTEYQQLLTEQNQENRSQLYSLYKEDEAAFREAYDAADTGSQLSFLHQLYDEESLPREEYLKLSAQILTTNASDTFDENKTYFVQNNKLYEVPTNFTDSDDALFFAREVVLFPDQEHRATSEHYLASDDENFLRALGSTNDESADTSSSWVKARDGVIVPMARTAAAIATGGKSEQLYSAIRLASGETLHGSDYANLVIGGLEQAGIIAPNATTIDPATGQEIIVPGTGLGNFTHGQTTQLIEAIGNQDPLSAALAVGGNNLITDNLEAIGIPTELANDPDFIEGTIAALETAVSGGNLQESLEDGLIEYITEGGGFGGVPDIDVGDLSSVLDPIVEVVQNVGDALEPIFDGVEDVAQVVGDVVEDVIIDPADDILDLLGSEVVDPILQAVEPIAAVVEDVIIDPIDDALDYVGSEFVDPAIQAAEDVAQEVGDVIEDYVVDPVDDVLDFVGEEIVDPVAQTIGDVAEDVVQTTGDVVEDVAQVIGDAVEEGVVDPVDDVLDYIGEEFVDPALQAGEDALQVTGDVLEDIGQSAGDIIEDVAQDTGAAVEDVAQVVGDVVEDAGQVVGDVVETVVDAIPEVDLPSVDLPSIDLPNINLNLPQITMPSFMASPRAGTRTTDTLFKDMLQFETEITAAPQIQRLGQQPLMPVAQVPTAPVLPQTNILGQFLQPTQATQRRPQGLLTGRRV